MGKYEAEERKRSEEVFLQAKMFFNTTDSEARQKVLLNVYHACTTRDDLVAHLLKAVCTEKENPLRITKLPNEFSEIEIEAKLEPSKEQCEALASTEIEKDLLSKTLENISLESDRFLKCPYLKAHDKAGRQLFVGKQGKQAMVIIAPEEKWNSGEYCKIKTKGELKTYDQHPWNIQKGKYVIRRTEKIKHTTDSYWKIKELAHEFADSLDAQCWEMEKRGVGQYIIEKNTGRVYALTLARCTTEKQKPLVQLELEYSGRIPSFPDTDELGLENKVVLDILELTSCLEKKRYTPTILTKFDWISKSHLKTS